MTRPYNINDPSTAWVCAPVTGFLARVASDSSSFRPRPAPPPRHHDPPSSTRFVLCFPRKQASPRPLIWRSDRRFWRAENAKPRKNHLREKLPRQDRCLIERPSMSFPTTIRLLSRLDWIAIEPRLDVFLQRFGGMRKGRN